jgi:hypothetical protein
MHNLIDERFGRLVVIERAEQRYHSQILWVCRCDCGNSTEVPTSSLTRGGTRSCGCLRREVQRDLHLKHGDARTPLYRVWVSMHDRCFNPNSGQWHNYGSRGIEICAEWSTYEPFGAWARANGYRADLSIERKDTNGNYTPDNCTWIPMSEQAAGRRSSRPVLRGDGVRYRTVTAAARAVNGSRNGMQKACARAGVYRGFTWRFDDAR